MPLQNARMPDQRKGGGSEGGREEREGEKEGGRGKEGVREGEEGEREGGRDMNTHNAGACM